MRSRPQRPLYYYVSYPNVDNLFKSFLAGVLCVCLPTFTFKTFKTMLYFIVLAAAAGYDPFHYAE